MKFQIYRTAGYGVTKVDELLAKYPVLANYKLKQTENGVVITISSLKALVQLGKDIGAELIVGSSGWDVDDSIEIYDNWRE